MAINSVISEGPRLVLYYCFPNMVSTLNVTPLADHSALMIAKFQKRIHIIDSCNDKTEPKVSPA